MTTFCHQAPFSAMDKSALYSITIILCVAVSLSIQARFANIIIIIIYNV